MAVFIAGERVDINIAIASAFYVFNLESVGTHLHFVGSTALGFVSFEDTVVIPCDIESGLPSPILIDVPAIRCLEFQTIVAYLTCVDRLRFAIGSGDIQELVT